MDGRETTEAGDAHRDWILRLLTGLFALAGFEPGGEPLLRLPRLVQNQIKRVLLPLESALRRLIYFLEQNLPETSEGEGVEKTAKKKAKRKTQGERKGRRAPVFQLFDKPIHCPELGDPHKRPPRGGPGPRIMFLDEWTPAPEPAPKTDPEDATKLCRRMQTMFRALQDLPGQARRLRRLLDKRETEEPYRYARCCPVRLGWAPGHRHTKTHEVDVLLYECGFMARHPHPPGR